jgi:hypothetical protein
LVFLNLLSKNKLKHACTDLLKYMYMYIVRKKLWASETETLSSFSCLFCCKWNLIKFVPTMYIEIKYCLIEKYTI